MDPILQAKIEENVKLKEDLNRSLEEFKKVQEEKDEIVKQLKAYQELGKVEEIKEKFDKFEEQIKKYKEVGEVEEIKEFFPQKIPKSLFAKEVFLIGSTNDPYMSVQELYQLQKELDVELKVLENAGHINTDSGFGKWPWILERVLKK